MVNGTNFLDMGMFNIGTISETTIHAIAQVLLIPVVIILIIFFIYSILNIGLLVAEYYKRRKEGINSQDIKDVILELKEVISDDMNPKNIVKNINNVIYNSRIPSYSKEALISIAENEDLDYKTQKSLAREIVEDEEIKLLKKMQLTDIISKIAPALGLMGTLIPLGPGLLALGSGDTQTLAESLIIAFDTTILGMAVASLSFTVSRIRKGWYIKDVDTLDNLAEFILEHLKC